LSQPNHSTLMLRHRDPAAVKMAYTTDSIWRNRDKFFTGRNAIEAFLTKKWEKEDGYRLRKELFAFIDNKVSGHVNTKETTIDMTPEHGETLKLTQPRQIAVQFWYEWFDESGQWWRTYGLEDWTFAENGLMRKRQMSGNDVKITEEGRWFRDGVNVDDVEILERDW
jgi:uncharacterized protein